MRRGRASAKTRDFANNAPRVQIKRAAQRNAFAVSPQKRNPQSVLARLECRRASHVGGENAPTAPPLHTHTHTHPAAGDISVKSRVFARGEEEGEGWLLGSRDRKRNSACVPFSGARVRLFTNCLEFAIYIYIYIYIISMRVCVYIHIYTHTHTHTHELYIRVRVCTNLGVASTPAFFSV